MSDQPFQRPPDRGHPAQQSQPHVPPIPASVPTAEVSVFVDREPGKPATPTVGRTGTVRFRGVVAASGAALLIGVAIGALTIDRPIPATPITVDSFPREVFGQVREDLDLRDDGNEAVIDRLDSHFEAQLAGYRFAYGGEGAQFRYGDFTTLTILNGRLAPEVPISDDTEWATPAAISLSTPDTSCVSWEFTGFTFETDPDTGVLIDSENSNDVGLAKVGTDCVLFDSRRDLSLRLEGENAGADIIKSAGEFRDELERIHATLIS